MWFSFPCFPSPFLMPQRLRVGHCKYSLTRTKHRHELSMFILLATMAQLKKWLGEARSYKCRSAWIFSQIHFCDFGMRKNSVSSFPLDHGTVGAPLPDTWWLCYPFKTPWLLIYYHTMMVVIMPNSEKMKYGYGVGSLVARIVDITAAQTHSLVD